MLGGSEAEAVDLFLNQFYFFMFVYLFSCYNVLYLFESESKWKFIIVLYGSWRAIQNKLRYHK